MPELKSFKIPERQLQKAEPISPPDISIEDSITPVDTEESLANMIAELKNVKEMAIDTEVRKTG